MEENMKGGWLTAKEISKITGLADRTVRAKIEEAKKEGIAVKTRGNRPKYYAVDSLKDVFPDHFEQLKAAAEEKEREEERARELLEAKEGEEQREEEAVERAFEKILGAHEGIEASKDTEEFSEALRIKMSIALHPDIFELYSLLRFKGYKGSLSDFINECVINFMREKGVRVQVTVPE